MKNNIGVMQGRLLKKFNGRYQAHPVGYWQDEFIQAQRFGLDCIEFILDHNDADKNPLLSNGGTEEIIEMTNKTGVGVFTICADYFMEAPLHSEDSKVALKSQLVLIKLLKSASKLGVTDIVIPCVDQSSLVKNSGKDRFVEIMKPIERIIDQYDINLSLETDLEPMPFVDLLNRFSSRHFKVNYDIGNSAAMGFDPVEELQAYGERISDIHIKDRKLGGGPEVLGQGHADFDRFFRKLKDFNYEGPFIMQAYRDDEGLEVFNKQYNWILPILQNTYLI